MANNDFLGLVRILDQDMETVGSGYLASQDGLIVSCAHVIENAGYSLGENINVEYNGDKLIAQIEEKYWKEAQKFDLVFLRIIGENLAKPSPMIISTSEWVVDKSAQAFGYPSLGNYKEDRITVKVLGLVNDAGNFGKLRLETIDTLKASDPVPGMSGGPIVIVENQQNIFVGIFEEFYEGTNRAWAVPVEKILELCSELKPQLPEEIDAYVKAVSRFCMEIPTVGTKSIFLDKIYVKQSLAYGKSETIAKVSENIPIHDAVLRFPKMVVFGGAGLGKSTLLRYVTTQYAGRIINGRPILPILISARGLAEKTVSFDQALREQIEAELGILLRNEIPIGFLDEWQKKSGCIWLISLDGVDEIRDPFQKRKFIDNLAEYPWPSASIVIITSRPSDSSITFPSEYQVFELVPFGKKQTEEFINLWFDDDLEKKQEVKKQLKIGLRTLEENPLLLTLVAQIFDSLNSLPRHRVDIYDYFINLLLDLRTTKALDFSGENWALRSIHKILVQEFPTTGEKIFDGRRNLFECIAFGYYDYQDIYEIVLQTFNLATISESQRVLQIFSSQRIGLINKGTQYEFVHSTFRDFLAAQRLVKIFQQDVAQIWRWIESRWNDNLRGVAIFALAILNKHNTNIQNILDEKLNDLPGLLFLSEYISITGETNEFGKKVMSKLFTRAKLTTRTEYWLGDSAMEGIRTLSYYPGIIENLQELIDDDQIDSIIQHEAKRIIANILDIDELKKYMMSKGTDLAGEGVRVLSELGLFDYLVDLAQQKPLSIVARLDIYDSFIKFNKFECLIDAIPKNDNNDTSVEYIANELIRKEKYCFLEKFMLWISQSPNTTSKTKDKVLTVLFTNYLNYPDITKPGFIISLLKNTQYLFMTDTCIKIFDLFFQQCRLHTIANVLVTLIYDTNFAHKIIRQRVTDKLLSVDSQEYISKYYFINDFLEYLQELNLDIAFLAESSNYDLANLLLSEDTGFDLLEKRTIRDRLVHKKYWDHFIPVLEINQSIKFEQTSNDTILLSCSPEIDGPFYSLQVPADVKLSIINFLRNKGNSKLKALLKSFAAVLALLIIKTNVVPLIFYIDYEYAKHSNEIKMYLLNYLSENLSINEGAITFISLDPSSSRSSRLALEIKQGLRPVNRIATHDEMLNLINRPARQNF